MSKRLILKRLVERASRHIYGVFVHGDRKILDGCTREIYLMMAIRL